MIDTIYDVAVIGAGMAGVTTSLYLSRAGLRVALVEKGLYGGVLNDTKEVENFPTYPLISGMDLAEKLEEHAREQENIHHLYGDVKELYRLREGFELTLRKKTIKAKTVIIATGVSYKKLNVPGEEKYTGQGVSSCATCDGNFFKGEDIIMVGGGDSAVEGALYLSNIANKVTLIHRRYTLRAENILQERLLAKDNVEFIWNAEVESIKGENGKVDRVIYLDKASGERYAEYAKGVFINIGIVPNTNNFKGLGILDDEGYVKVDKNMQTYVDGLYAIGDVRADSERQIVNASADGVIASRAVAKYLEEL